MGYRSVFILRQILMYGWRLHPYTKNGNKTAPKSFSTPNIWNKSQVDERLTHKTTSTDVNTKDQVDGKIPDF